MLSGVESSSRCDEKIFYCNVQSLLQNNELHSITKCVRGVKWCRCSKEQNSKSIVKECENIKMNSLTLKV